MPRKPKQIDLNQEVLSIFKTSSSLFLKLGYTAENKTAKLDTQTNAELLEMVDTIKSIKKKLTSLEGLINAKLKENIIQGDNKENEQRKFKIKVK